jgi:hypothetical protein
MAANERQQTSRLNQFKEDLKALEIKDIVRKHIVTALPVGMTADEYFELRQVVANQFELYPSEVVLVGSCQLGFSLNPDHRYQQFRGDSDFDIAIVSPTRFDSYWDHVFEYAMNDAAWSTSPAYKHFKSMLFKGWIDPRGLPSVTRFRQAQEWADFFDSLMSSRRFGKRRITARLYRTWGRLEAYQGKSVRQCLTILSQENE